MKKTSFKVGPLEEKIRLDKFLALQWPQFSRASITSFIKKSLVWIDGKEAQAKDLLKEGQEILLGFDEKDLEVMGNVLQELKEEKGDLVIIDESEHYIILNKPAGLVVHPGAGVYEGTCANYLAHDYPMTQDLPNYGLIHRLDKDTTGLMVIAKSHEGYVALNKMMQRREISRQYLALVHGIIKIPQTIQTRIARDPHQRLKKAVSYDLQAREAITHIQPMKLFSKMTLLECTLETGRTHQIRLHMEHIRHPLVGDKLYHGSYPAGFGLGRQALHAYKLGFVDPFTDEEKFYEVEMPEDLSNFIESLT